MKEYIYEIISVLEDKINPIDKESAFLFRLDNFVHPQIYLDLCRYFKIIAREKGLNFNAKLSKEQYAIFLAHKEFKPYLENLELEGYIEKSVPMTTWRNSVADQKGVLFLMGTENVMDKGGLADFYKISPEIIELQVGKKYANWFIKLIDIEDKFEKTVINNFIDRLFRVVPKDLYKLSCIIDSLEEERISGIAEVLDCIGRNLEKDWGLPSIYSFDSKTINSLGKDRKFDLFEKAKKFKNRAEFKDGLTRAKFNKLQNKIEDFKASGKLDDYSDSIVKINELFGSFSDFEKALIDYFKGKDLEILRPKFFQLDFNFINAILNYKVSIGPKQPKETIFKVYGTPFEAFSKIIFNILHNNFDDDIQKHSLKFNITEAVLSNYVEDNEYDLYNAWSKICFATGGFIEYLQEELADIEIGYVGEKDPFLFSNLEEISIKPTKGTQTLSYIMISVFLNEAEKPFEFKWIFNPNEYWLNTYDINLLDKLIEQVQDLRFLPVFYNHSLGNLLASVDSDIFFHQLNESELNFVNVNELLPKELREGLLSAKFYQLSQPFIEFLHNLKNEGFYNTVNSRKTQSAIQFVNKYTNIIQDIIKKSDSISTVEKKYLHLLSNLFLILKSKEAANQEYLEGAIVPPLHPAMLEKIIEQQAFYRKGFSSLINELLNGSSNTMRNFEKEIENIVRQSTIISGLDTIISNEPSSRLCKEVYGFYALHGDIIDDSSLESVALLDSDLVFDEEFNTKQMLKNSFMSRLISGKLTEYVQTFPSQSDCIKIGFINFYHLQPVVAGVHAFIEKLKKICHKINIKLQIISPNSLQEGRTYVNFWLDNFFDDDINVNIETFYRSINFEELNLLNLEGILLNHDMIFVNNVMTAGKINYRYTGEQNIPPSETRFPMVFHPMPIFNDEKVRKVSVSQRQFLAAFYHSQLTGWVENPDSKDGIYRVEKELMMTQQMSKLLDFVHEKARWVVSLDTALDRKFFDPEKVISFSTGEGPFGELNMIVSASSDVRDDVVRRLKKRIRDLFPSWEKEKLNASARYCIDQSMDLDGIKALKALNPYDYEIHSFLSYILSVKSLRVADKDENTLLKVYIPLDSYIHWFNDANNRPDYLLVEINRDGIINDHIEINATVVECKMGKESNTQIEKGFTQLINSIEYLSKIFNGYSNEYNRRYWFAQLYRSLVFAPNFISNIENEQIEFNQSLMKILEGKFKINWSGKLLTYWLDLNQDELESYKIPLDSPDIICEHYAFGQLYVQKNLQPIDLSTDLKYEHLDRQLLSFANNRTDFEILIEENENLIEEIEIEQTTKNKVAITTQTNQVENHGFSKSHPSNVSKLTTENEQKVEDIGKVVPKEKTFSNNSEDMNINNSGDSNIRKTDSITENTNTLDTDFLLEKVRVLLGKDIKTKQEIYWEYGHAQLENRHILISGKSGVGKTYFIQCLLYELAECGISSIVFDYTDGFKKSKLEPEFVNGLGDRIEQFLVFKNKFPINPFKRNLKELDEDEFYPESDEDVAERIKSVFLAVFELGPQQANALYQATKEGLRKYGDEMDLQLLGKELESLGNSYALTTLSKLQSIIDRNPFDTTTTYNWDKHIEQKGKVFIVQLTGYSRDVQLIITEFILWDLWNYLLSHGDKTRPFPAIIDEAQNLDHSENSPSAKILTEGRKFGWSGWYATQFLQAQLKKDEIQRLQNASQKIYFSPPEEEITNIAAYLDTDSYKRKEWAKKLSGLRKGQCIVWGPTLQSDGNLKRNTPCIVDVSPFSERIKKK